ncbi:hypothetical protein GFJ94_03180 [Flavobacterium sp. LMO8]|uniref:hypothetical protein n=1 Tax=Flavobacterium sp. LMO8 TaxID=2654244 RepID=UPI001292226E|nr:hypothetical protein [Flavobacterium sp. LMO8]MQP24065.1 hypothetical protein [Flavobacterium sp. LMO8]
MKKLFLLLVCFVLTIDLNAQSADDYNLEYDLSKTGCIEGDCENGYGVYVNEKGKVFKGIWKEKALEGVAQIINYTSGDRYIGETSRGYYHGIGIYLKSNGYVYFGSWNWNKSQGIGVAFKDGQVNKGYFKDGTFVKDQIQGAVAGIANIDLSKKGCISGDCVNGYGIFVFDDGAVYFGTWKNKQLEGIGSFYFNSGSVYCGEFKNGTFYGFGAIMYNPGPSLEAYIGNWINNKKSGEGLYISKDGTYKNGQWNNDEYKSN